MSSSAPPSCRQPRQADRATACAVTDHRRFQIKHARRFSGVITASACPAPESPRRASSPDGRQAAAMFTHAGPPTASCPLLDLRQACHHVDLHLRSRKVVGFSSSRIRSFPAPASWQSTPAAAGRPTDCDGAVASPCSAVRSSAWVQRPCRLRPLPQKGLVRIAPLTDHVRAPSPLGAMAPACSVPPPGDFTGVKRGVGVPSRSPCRLRGSGSAPAP